MFPDLQLRGEGPASEGALPFNAWLVQQTRSREQREGRYNDDSVHTQKMPPELARRMILHARLQPGAVVLDPFAGTGTTLVEAIEMGLYAVGYEIEADVVDKSTRRNLVAAVERGAPGLSRVHIGDARNLAKVADASVDAIVTSPPYGDSDPATDSSGWSLKERVERGDPHALRLQRQSRLVLAMPQRHPDSMALLPDPLYSTAMTEALAEMRRVLKPGGHALIAVREYWNDAGLVDLPGQILSWGRGVGLVPVDKIYAMEAAVDEWGRLQSRATLHRHRIANQQHADGRGCPRGVPAVTTVCVLRRRPPAPSRAQEPPAGVLPAGTPTAQELPL